MWSRLKRAFGAGAAPAPRRADAGPAYERGLDAEREGRDADAAELFRAAAAAEPGRAEVHYALGAALKRCGSAEESLAAFRAGLALDPDNARMRSDLSLALCALERLDEACAEGERARDLAPDLAEVRNNLGHVYRQLGLIEPAIAEAEIAHRIAPDHIAIHSNLLFLLTCSARRSAEAVFAAHREFGERHVQPVAAPAPDPAWPRRLRIGYVSPDFRSHVVASFMLPVIARHDRARFEVFAYYSYAEADQVTAALREMADDWLDCARLSDAELAARIRADGVDILVDLAGHTAHHRLGVFALRPAPLQLTWLGYPNTTGLTAIDARLSDALADPPGASDRFCVERLARLPRSFLCYRPGPDLFPLEAPPAAASGVVTFGCFNNFQKMSEPFLDVAAHLLAAVPGSRLLLKARPLGTSSVVRRVREHFARHGIEATRLELRGWEPSPESHLAAYRQVDIALDSFPYAGTTTTCEALWMGVPVVTLAGDRHAARVGVSLLATVGLSEFIARDADDFVQIAARLAQDLPRLAALRAGMRERVCASALRDEAGFVRELEDAYIALWREKIAPAAPVATLADARALCSGGKLAEARAACEAILRADPAQQETLELHWSLCHDLGDNAPAVDAIGRALAAGGPSARLQFMLGCTMEDLARPRDAAAAYRNTLALDPAHAKAANNLGCLQELAGEFDGAEQSYAVALRADPTLANALANRGNLARLRGRLEAAEADLRQALALEPGRADWHSGFADLCLLRWRLDEAVAGQRAALALEPASARAHFGLANALMMLGLADEAEASFRRALELEPDLAEAHSNLLLCLHYRKGDDGALLHAEHLAWAGRHAAGLHLPVGHAALDRAPGRRLNVGYLSPNFHRHSVASFLEPLLAAHDRGQLRVFGYSCVERPDAVTERLKGLCDEWRELRGLSGDAAARRIRADRIDILVDLAGHTGGGRPLVFARKPAPVQVTWMGYPDTTGLAEMDYRLTDAEADPVGATERWHSEKLLRLPRGFLCFAPEPGGPEPGPSPARAKGFVTFGCFNNLAKVTPEMVALWARLVAEVPGSRLVLKAHALGAASARQRVQEQFVRGGAEAHRLTLLGPEDAASDHLARYREVDIALDTYPYHGTTTTCEALWMGVPVVTRAGPTHVARVGASLLHRVGLDDLVANDAEGYLRLATSLAADTARLQSLREGLRARLRASPLMDAAGFARSVEDAYRAAWMRWLQEGELAAVQAEPLRLHIGGQEPRPGWKILNVQPGPGVDFVGDCADLGRFADGSVEEVYASHVLEHLGYQEELPRALAEFHRVLRPGGVARISVPDFEVLCRLFASPGATAVDRFHIMRIVFGGQMDAHDVHRVGLSWEFLAHYLRKAGFSTVERVEEFGLFHDSSLVEHRGERVSLNVVAVK